MNKYQSYKSSSIEWIGDIPSNWSVTKIKYTKNDTKDSFIDGDWIESKDLCDEGIRYITSGNIGEGKYKEQGKGYISEDTFNKLNCTEIFEGDLIISRLFLPVGRSCILPNLNNRVVTCVDNVVLRPKESFNKFYLNYQFNSNRYSEFTELISRGVTLTRISRGMLGNNSIVVPPLNEQHQIVQYLDKKTKLIDSLIDITQRKIELLKEKRLSLIDKVILDKTIDRVRLKYGVDLMNRPIDRNNGTSYTKIGMYNWGRGIFKYDEEEGSELGDSEFSFIREGDLLLSGQFSWEGSVSIVENEFDGCISSHRFYILNGKKNILMTEYLWAFFTSQEGHLILDDNSIGSAGRNRPLNIGKLLKEKIPFPNLEIQKKIKDFVITERENIKFSVKLISLLKEYRQSLISEVVTGKIKVTTDE